MRSWSPRAERPGSPKGSCSPTSRSRPRRGPRRPGWAVDPARHRWLACLPLNHVGGLSVVTRSLVTGTELTVLPRFDAQAVAAASGPDVFVSLVLDRSPPGRAAGMFQHGCPGRVDGPRRAWRRTCVTTYGLTETGSGVVYDGVPLDGVEVRGGP